MKDALNNIARAFDDLPMDWPEAHLQLIDALRDFLRADRAVGMDLLQDGTISREDYDNAMLTNAPLEAVLRELESHGSDPTLYGLIKEKRR